MPAPKVGSRYELRRQLEQRDGILSFEGWDTQAQRDVLALLMRASGNGTAEEQTRLLQFARLAGLAGVTPDSALPAILDSGSDPPDQNGETAYYLIAEWVSGTSLDSKLPLDPEQAVAAVRSIGEGLRWARQRWAGASPSYDLDPARIVFDDTGRTRLTSFGLPGLGGEEGEQGDVLALGNLLRTLLAGGASNEARSLSAAQALALAQVIGRSTAPVSNRYPDIATFLDALQAALAGRQTADPRFIARGPVPTIKPSTPASRAKKKKTVTDPLTPPIPLTVSPVPDQLADQPADDALTANGSGVPSAPPSMGPVPQSTSHLVDAAEFTPPAPPVASDNGADGSVTVIRGEIPPIVVQNQPAAVVGTEADSADAPTQVNPALHPTYRSGSTNSTFGDPPTAVFPDVSAVGRNTSKRPPILRPAPRLVDPQTGQLRGDLYVAGSRPSGAQRVIGSLTQSNQRIVYLVGAIIVLILILLLVVVLQGRNNQPTTLTATTSTPAPTTTAVLALLATSTPAPSNVPPTPTQVQAVVVTATVAPPSPTTVPISPTAELPISPTAVPVAQATPCAVSLADVPPSDANYGPISAMICRQAFYPAPGGNFAPNTAVTRAEIAHAVVAVMGWAVDPNAANPFRDVQPSTPYYADILTAIEHGAMSGIASDQFSPNGKLSRIQAIRVVVKAAGWPTADPSTVAHYGDVLNNNPLFIFVEAAYAHGMIGPTPNGLLRPNDPATRKDVALMLNNMLNSR